MNRSDFVLALIVGVIIGALLLAVELAWQPETSWDDAARIACLSVDPAGMHLKCHR